MYKVDNRPVCSYSTYVDWAYTFHQIWFGNSILETNEYLVKSCTVQPSEQPISFSLVYSWFRTLETFPNIGCASEFVIVRAALCFAPWIWSQHRIYLRNTKALTVPLYYPIHWQTMCSCHVLLNFALSKLYWNSARHPHSHLMMFSLYK